METKAKLLLVGCGKMGGALLQRVLATHTNPQNIRVVEPAPPPDSLKIPSQLKWVASPDKLDKAFEPDIVLLAVKPQSIAAVVPQYARFKNCVFLSVAAGTPIARVQEFLSEGQPVIRAMPNLPASIGKGISVAIANKNVSALQCMLADRVLKTVGETAWVEDEELLDAVTALSGSGPAYIFALCEAMAKAGENLGLPAALAAQLARETIIGSGAMLEQSSDTAETLRQMVTSPGGTTEAALKLLLASGGLFDLMQKAMQAAVDRGKELARLQNK